MYLQIHYQLSQDLPNQNQEKITKFTQRQQ